MLKPDAAAIAAAAGAGAKLAKPLLGYLLKDYVVYAVRDARAIDPADGNVDAVVLATPLERTRHAAFLAAYAGKAISPMEARQRAKLADGQVRIIVFAHGASAADQDFAGGFGKAMLTVGDRTLEAEAAGSDPSEAVYPLAATDRNRFVATITYSFDLSGTTGTGPARLGFTDASGKTFDIPIDLSAYR